MAYTRVNWKDLPDTSTPITAENLNKMDEQIAKIGGAIRVQNSVDQNMETETHTTIIFDTVDFNTTENLTLSNGSIKIGSNINCVLVTGRWTSFSISNNNDNNYVYIYKNDERIAFKCTRGDYTQEITAIIPVQENDIIKLTGYQSGSSTIVVTATPAATFLEVTILS